MAYGKIKADTFVYDNSGSDVEVTVSTIPPGNSPTFTGNVTINAQGDIRLADSDSSNYVGFQAPATVASNVVWTLPSADGSSGQQLSTNGSGVLSWTAPTNTAAADLTGNTLASGVTASSLTSVGTLTGLTVAGNYAQTLTADGGFTATAAGNHAISITGDANRSADTNTLISIHGKWNGTKVATIDFQAGDDTTNKDNGQIVFYTAAAGSEAVALTIAEDKSATFTGTVSTTGTVSDSKGNVRSVPTRNETSAYTLVAADAGKCITADNGVTVNTSVFSAGDVVTIINSATSDKTITQGSGMTMRNVGDDGNTGNVTVKKYAMCTLIFTSHDVCFFSTTAKA